MIEFFNSFIYNQNSQPINKDIICFYDVQEENFVKVRIISKSNYRYYYNINFMEIGRPNAGIYLRPNDFWSHSLPVPREPAQEHLEDLEIVQEQDDNLLPQIEQERQSGSQPSSHRQISPMLSHYGASSIRSDRVYRLPVDQFCHQLSPRSKKKADRLRLPPEQEYMRSAIGRSLASSSSSAPKSRMTNFMEKVILGKKY